MNMDIDVSYEIPNAQEYNNLRIVSGLSPKDEVASEVGLKNSIFIVTLRDSVKLIGMGRIIWIKAAFIISWTLPLPTHIRETDYVRNRYIPGE